MTKTLKFASEVLAQHIAVLGKTGSGKTSTAKLIVEQAVAEGARVCVLDPIKSDWWGLTSNTTGTKAGLPFHILVGPRGHVPLHASAGAAVAEIVANGSLPLSIIDMADFEPGGQARFFTQFAPALLRKMRGVVYLVLEEAHLFAPKERSGVGDENMSIHWAKMLATAGRSKGVRLVLVTQRTQALHNALLGSCDTVIAHRLTAPADQKPVVGWLKANVKADVMKRVAASLAGLKTGHGWLCSCEARIFEERAFPRISTYDNTATPTGDGTDHEVKTAPVDQDKLRAIIGGAVEEAKANDPKELRKQLTEARRQIEAMNADVKKTRTSLQPVDVPVFTDADRTALLTLADRHTETQKFLSDGATAVMGRLRVVVEEAVEAAGARIEGLISKGRATFQHDLEAKGVQRIIEKLDRVAAPSHLTKPAQTSGLLNTHRGAPRPAVKAVSAQPARSGNGVRPAGGEGKLEPAKQRILNAIAWLNSIRVQDWTREVVAFVAGASSRSSAYANNVSALRTAGYLEYPQQNYLALTDAGTAAAQAPDAPLTPEDLHRQIEALLEPAQWRIVVAAIRAYPQSLTRAELAASAGASEASSAFANNVSRVRTLGLVDYPQQGSVVGTPLLFLEGR